MPNPQFKEMRRAYGFDEVALVPGDATINPEQTKIDLDLGGLIFPLPIMAAAMDAVVDPDFAILFGQKGGAAVLNLEGVWTRYQDPSEALETIAITPQDQITPLLQKVYSEPIKENLIGERIRQIKGGGVRAV
ncbi:MAG: IMP dehydrogenase, partial [Dehalococcoidia bacterium]